jgi:CO dehydrogenase nickel-insertion accessory protein CooC1
MGIYLIGIGGSGAKCVEAVVQLASVGLFTQEPIKVLFVDADESNGNLERSRNSLNIYNKCYQAAIGKDKQQCPWMQTEIQSFGLWSPFANNSLNKELSAFFNYNTIEQSQPELAHLFDVLYTDREKQEQLDVGFRGRPAIGAAVMISNPFNHP